MERVIELLEDIDYQLRLSNWQQAGGKGPRPRHAADASHRSFDGVVVKCVQDSA